LPSAAASGSTSHFANAAQAIRAIMDTPEDKIDFAREKFRLDKLIDPSTDAESGVRQVDDTASTIRAMEEAGVDIARSRHNS
jgi:hypothetical protein